MGTMYCTWNTYAIDFFCILAVLATIFADAHVDEVDSALVKFGKQCNTQSKDMLKYIGTPANVRDMVALHDYLEGKKPINYWGVS